MTATPEQAIAAARSQSENGPRFDTGLCLQRVRLCYGVAAKYPDAATAWKYAVHKHTRGTPARGTLVFWTGGSAGHGHIAIATGDGYCWSTDIERPGYFDKVPIDRIAQKWGMQYVGFAEDVNGVRVIRLPRDTHWARVRKALIAALTSPDAQAISTKRRVVRAFIATTLAAVKKTPID